jgi:hypothetical protein
VELQGTWSLVSKRTCEPIDSKEDSVHTVVSEGQVAVMEYEPDLHHMSARSCEINISLVLSDLAKCDGYSSHI